MALSISSIVKHCLQVWQGQLEGSPAVANTPRGQSLARASCSEWLHWDPADTVQSTLAWDTFNHLVCSIQGNLEDFLAEDILYSGPEKGINPLHSISKCVFSNKKVNIIRGSPICGSKVLH